MRGAPLGSAIARPPARRAWPASSAPRRPDRPSVSPAAATARSAGAPSGHRHRPPQPGASRVWRSSSTAPRNVRVQDVTITEGYLTGGTRNVTIAHSRFTGIMSSIRGHDAQTSFWTTTRTTTSRAPPTTTRRGFTSTPPAWWSRTRCSRAEPPTGSGSVTLLTPRSSGTSSRPSTDVDPLHTDPIQFYGERPVDNDSGQLVPRHGGGQRASS